MKKRDWTRKVEETADGSSTFFIPEWNERYHSGHGALQEGIHVFIKMGLATKLDLPELNIFEMGLGTGLNFLLSYKSAKAEQAINYFALEAFPLEEKEWKALPTPVEGLADEYQMLHLAPWNEEFKLRNFTVKKIHNSLEEHMFQSNFYDLVYYDAFGPRVQPELWTLDVFKRFYVAMRSNGTLVTYCAKGQVRRDLQAAGFEVERLPGPPGKREMLRATKKS